MLPRSECRFLEVADCIGQPGGELSRSTFPPFRETISRGLEVRLPRLRWRSLRQCNQFRFVCGDSRQNNQPVALLACPLPMWTLEMSSDDGLARLRLGIQHRRLPSSLFEVRRYRQLQSDDLRREPGSQRLQDRGLQAGGFRLVPDDWLCVDGRYCFEAVSSSLFSEPFSGIVLASITELRK